MSQLTVPEAGKQLPLSIKEIFFDEETLAARVSEIANQITSDYQHRDLVVVGILKGAHVFTCDLVRQLGIPAAIDFISISRYRRRPDLKEVTVTHDLEVDIKGRDLLLVEDIVDTGLTLNYLIKVLEERDPASVKVCSLLDRPALRLAEIPMTYVGFNVQDEFCNIIHNLDVTGAEG